MQFENYIYEIGTGEEIDELQVFLWQQDDATFAGVNLKGLLHLANIGNGDLDFNFLFDVVRGELDGGPDNRNLPRIPAARSGFGLSWKNDSWETSIDYLRVNNQRRVADFELPTDSYEDLSVFVQRKMNLAGNEVNVFLHGRNLTDDEQRRRWEVGIRMDF